MQRNADNFDVNFDDLVAEIREDIKHYVKLMVEGSNICDLGHRDWAPVPLLSSFISDCIDNGKDITYGGGRYNFSGVQGIGIANLSDSLHALKRYVFEEKRCTFKEFIATLDNNFDVPNGDKIRARLMNKYEKYGNDIDEVDALVLSCFVCSVKRLSSTIILVVVSLRLGLTPCLRTCLSVRLLVQPPMVVCRVNSLPMVVCRQC